VALHGLPLHIIRDLYVTARSFFRRCGDLRRYRRATQDMEQRYPTLTSDDLTSMSDHVCVVCREEMTLPPPIGGNTDQNLPEQRPTSRYRLPGDLPKRLPCGHAFHFRCLRSWLERQQSCPTWYV
jgi:E3 ubiquitin-protein ligase synoviolin